MIDEREGMSTKIVVMGSTRGSSMQGLLDAIDSNTIQATISLVVSDREHAPILQRVRNYHIPTLTKNAKGIERAAYDKGIIDIINAYNPDVVLMIGYMRIVSSLFTDAFKDRLLNIHPSLLPKHGGLMDLAVHQSVLDAGDSETGCTIHKVTPDVDGGEHVLQLQCPVDKNDTAETLKAKVQALENKALVTVIKHWKQAKDEDK